MNPINPDLLKELKEQIEVEKKLVADKIKSIQEGKGNAILFDTELLNLKQIELLDLLIRKQ